MIARSLFCVALPLTVLVAGCASTGGEFPDLAIRDGERVSGTIAAPEPAPLPQPPDSAISRLGTLAAQARTAHAAFTSATASASTRVSAARSAPAGSESWALAEIALGNLSSLRNTTMVALADLDRIYIDAANAGESTIAIAPIRTEVERLVAEEDAVLRRLAEQLGR